MTFSKDLRFRLEYAGFRLAQGLARALPVETASAISGASWRLIAPHLYRQERVMRNLALAYPEMPIKDRKRLAAKMWENLGRTFAESFQLEKIAAQGRVTVESMEMVEAIARAPCIICGLHLGNWELIAYPGKSLGFPVTGVYQRMSNPLVDAETHKMRAFLYEGGLLPKTPVTARQMRKAARSGGHPAFLADLRDDRGAAVPFFGHPARSNVFPALLARVSGLPLYAAAACRLPNVRFRIKVARIPIPETDDRDADAVAATATLQAQFEDFIRAAPEQWMWAHRKWD